MKKLQQQFLTSALILTFTGSLLTACNLDVVGGKSGGAETSVSTSANQKNGALEGNQLTAEKSEPQTKQAATVAIYDGRESEFKPNEGTAADAQLVNQEFKRNEAAIMAKTEMKCDETDGKAAIVDSAEGSFTKPNAAQKIFLYERCRLGRSFGIGGILVTENGTAVAHYSYGDNGLSMGLKSLPDINKNGLSEIMMIDGGSGQGYSSTAVSFYEIKNGNLEYIGNEAVYTSNSGAVENDRDVKTEASKITVQPTAAPIFFRETYEQKGNSQKWTLVKKAEKFTLGKGEPLKYNKIN